MSKRVFLFLVALLTVALVGSAADVAGKWAYEQPGRGGAPPAKTTLDLKTDGSKLSGTVTVQRGGGGIGGGTPPTIRNGKIDGNRVEFEVVREFQGNQVVSKYEGAVSGDELKLKISTETANGPRTNEVTAKRENK